MYYVLPGCRGFLSLIELWYIERQDALSQDCAVRLFPLWVSWWCEWKPFIYKYCLGANTVISHLQMQICTGLICNRTHLSRFIMFLIDLIFTQLVLSYIKHYTFVSLWIYFTVISVQTSVTIMYMKSGFYSNTVTGKLMNRWRWSAYWRWECSSNICLTDWQY